VKVSWHIQNVLRLKTIKPLGTTGSYNRIFQIFLASKWHASFYAYHHGELSNTQKQAVITLIEKKDKDWRSIKNWRPISFVNVDVKIGSEAIAKRLEDVLPHIIHYDQNAFVKGRTIFDAVHTISDAMDFTKTKRLPRYYDVYWLWKSLWLGWKRTEISRICRWHDIICSW